MSRSRRHYIEQLERRDLLAANSMEFGRAFGVLDAGATDGDVWRQAERAARIKQDAIESFFDQTLSTSPGGTRGQASLRIVGFDLAYLHSEHAEHKREASKFVGPTSFESRVSPLAVSGESVTIDVIADGDPAALRESLNQLGMQVTGQWNHVISGRLQIDALDELAALDGVRMARPFLAQTASGAVVSQGDHAQMTEDLRDSFDLDGSGVTIGVLSDSFDSLGDAADDVANGELPGAANPGEYKTDVHVISDNSYGGTDEGRAMLQVVHDIAPAAELAFATASLGQAAFAQSISDLTTIAGADIIVDDVLYFAEPFFQDGIIAQAANEAHMNGVAYFSAAGNNANNSYESDYRPGSVYSSSTYTPIGNAPPLAAGTAHDFDPGSGSDDLQGFSLAAGQSMTLSLQWDQPFASVSGGAGAATDMDIFVLNDSNQIVAGSVDYNVGADPVEILQYTSAGGGDYSVLIIKREGPDPNRLKYVNITNGGLGMSGLEYATASSTLYGHANTLGAVAVGAASWTDTPEFGTSPPTVQDFSSTGGTEILFDTSGTPLPAPLVYNKPDLVAPDGGNNSFFGLDSPDDSDSWPNFSGTSAAAAHAAGAAALLLGIRPGTQPDDLYTALRDTTVDMQAAGFDFASGYGLLDASAANAQLNPLTTNLDATGILDATTFSGSETYTAATYISQVLGDDYIPVDLSRPYHLSGWGRSGNDDGSEYNASSYQYFGFVSYDADHNVIAPSHYQKVPGAVDTYLVEEINDNAQSIHIADGTGWYEGTNSWERALAWYGYTDSSGTYPDFTYTRNTIYNSAGAWGVDGIDFDPDGDPTTKDAIITLSQPWNRGHVPAGTAIRNAASYAGTYNYAALYAGYVPNTLTQYTATISGVNTPVSSADNQFRPGTAFIKPVFLVNLGPPTDNRITWQDVEFSYAAPEPFHAGDQVDLHLNTVEFSGPVTYQWTQTDGPTVTLSGDDQPTASFTALTSLADHDVTFDVSVTDGTTVLTDSVTVGVEKWGDATPDDAVGVLDATTFSGSETYSAASYVSQVLGDDYIPVDLSRPYHLSGWGRSGNDDGSEYNASSYQYFGFVSYDADHNVIAPSHYQKVPGAVDTYLVEEINDNAQSIHIADGTGWYEGTNSWERALAWYGYTDSSGTYPDFTYTRNTIYNGAGAWGVDGIDFDPDGDPTTKDAIITLSQPWNRGHVPAGTAIRNAASYAGTYNYAALYAGYVPNTLTQYTATISGVNTPVSSADNQFRPGTSFIKPVFLVNLGPPTDNRITWQDVEFSYAAPEPFHAGDQVDLHVNTVDFSGPVTYQWTQTDGPTVTLSGDDQPTASFTALTSLADHDVTFDVSVTDGTTVLTDSVTVGVEKWGDATPDDAVGVLDATTFSGSETYTAASYVSQVLGDDYIPVDLSRPYHLSGWGRSGNDDGSEYNASSYQYFGFVSYDADHNVIAPSHYQKVPGAVDTYLVEEINDNAQSIHIADGTGWYEGTNSWERALAWYGYTDSSGTYPDFTYTRNTIYNGAGAWGVDGIDFDPDGDPTTKDAIITLSQPWNRGHVPAGTAIRNAASYAGTYNYAALYAGYVPNTLTQYTATISGVNTPVSSADNQFRPGTAFIKPVFLVNLGPPTDNRITWQDVELSYAAPEPFHAGDQVDLHLNTVEFSGPVTYQWTQTDGPTVTLSGDDQPTASFTALTTLADHDLTFDVTASDGATVLTDSVTVSVEKATDAPIALNATGVIDSLTYEGTLSLPPVDFVNTVTYEWVQTGGPTVVLDGQDRRVATFTADKRFVDYDLTFDVAVSDGWTVVTEAVVVTVPHIDPLVRFRLETTDLQGSPITSVEVDEQFMLNVYVEDLQPTPTGVYTAYLDVGFDGQLASAIAITDWAYGYSHGASGDVASGVLDEAGGRSITSLPTGGGEERLFSAVLRADAAGMLELAGNPADDRPIRDILLFEHDDPIDTDYVDYGGIDFEILPGGFTGLMPCQYEITDLSAVTNPIFEGSYHPNSNSTGDPGMPSYTSISGTLTASGQCGTFAQVAISISGDADSYDAQEEVFFASLVNGDTTSNPKEFSVPAQGGPDGPFSFVVAALDDPDASLERLTVTASIDNGEVEVAQSVEVTIVDDDGPPCQLTLATDPTSLAEGDPGDEEATTTLKLTAFGLCSGETATVSWAGSGNRAEYPGDFTVLNLDDTAFPLGSSLMLSPVSGVDFTYEATLKLELINDELVEQESSQITLTAMLTGGDSEDLELPVDDDDEKPELNVSADIDQTEEPLGDSHYCATNPAPGEFFFSTLDLPTSVTSTVVKFSIDPQSTAETADYLLSSKNADDTLTGPDAGGVYTLTIADDPATQPRDIEATVLVTPIADSEDEGAESVKIKIEQETIDQFTLFLQSTTVTIGDTDPEELSFAVDDPEAKELNEEEGAFVVTPASSTTGLGATIQLCTSFRVFVDATGSSDPNTTVAQPGNGPGSGTSGDYHLEDEQGNTIPLHQQPPGPNGEDLWATDPISAQNVADFPIIVKPNDDPDVENTEDVKAWIEGLTNIEVVHIEDDDVLPGPSGARAEPYGSSDDDCSCPCRTCAAAGLSVDHHTGQPTYAIGGLSGGFLQYVGEGTHGTQPIVKVELQRPATGWPALVDINLGVDDWFDDTDPMNVLTTSASTTFSLDTSSFSDESVAIAVPLDLADYGTGSYRFTLDAAEQANPTTAWQAIQTSQLVNNLHDSNPLAPGLVFPFESRVLETSMYVLTESGAEQREGVGIFRGDTSASWYEKLADDSYKRPPESVTKLTLEARDGEDVYVFTDRFGVEELFHKAGTDAGRLWKIVDTNDNETVFTYHPGGSLHTVTDPLQHVTTVSAPSAGDFTITDFAGRVTAFDYDSTNQWLTITHPDPDVVDAGGNPIDRGSQLYERLAFDQYDRLESITLSDDLSFADGQQTKIHYADLDFGYSRPWGRVGSVDRDVMDGTPESTWTLNTFGQSALLPSTASAASPLTWTVNASSVLTLDSFDASGYSAMVTVADDEQKTTVYTLDHRGRAKTVQDAHGQTFNYSRHFARDEFGNVVADRGEVVGFSTPDPDDFTQRGDLAVELRSDGPLNSQVTSSAYDDDLNITSHMLAPLASASPLPLTWSGYQLGRPGTFTDELGNSTTNQFVLDGTANVDSSTAFAPSQAAPNRGNVAAWTNPFDHFDVNKDGAKLSPTDQVNVVNELNNKIFSDEFGKLPADHDPIHPFVDVNADGFVSAIDSLILVNKLNVGDVEPANDLSRPEDYVVDYMYTPVDNDSPGAGGDGLLNGLVETETMTTGRAQNLTTSYEYYTLSANAGSSGLLKKVTFADGTADAGWIEYTYDARGNVATVEEQIDATTSRTTTFIYDNLNRLVQVTAPDPHEERFFLSILGDGNSVTEGATLTLTDTATVPLTVTFEFDSDGSWASGNVAVAFVGKTEEELATAIAAALGASALAVSTDVAGTSLKVTGATSVTLQNLFAVDLVEEAAVREYAYDAFGNLTHVTQRNFDPIAQSPSLHTTCLGYDNRNRLQWTVAPHPQQDSGSCTDFVLTVTGDGTTINNRASLAITSSSSTPSTVTFEFSLFGVPLLPGPVGIATDGKTQAELTTDLATKIAEALNVQVTADETSGTITIKGANSITSFDLASIDIATQTAATGSWLSVSTAWPGRPVTFNAYDGHNNLVETIDPRGNATNFEYDDLNRLVTIIEPNPGTSLDATVSGTRLNLDPSAGEVNGPITTFVYDNLNNLWAVTDALGNTTDYRYDDWNRLTSVLAPAVLDPATGGNVRPETQYGYEHSPYGWITRVTDAQGRVTETQADFLGRTQYIAEPAVDGERPVTWYEYYADGALKSMTDALQNRTTYDYDDRARLTSVIAADPDGPGPLVSPVTEYGYDRANQLLTITDPLQRVTTYDYDLVGRITQVTSPDPMTGVAGANSPTMHYTYDAVGNVLQVSDAEVRTLGYLTRYSYDQLFRRTAETDGNGDVTTFEYDLADNLTKLTDPNGNPTSWTIDGSDRVHIETDVFNNPRTYLYDAVGNERKMTDRRGLVTEYQYDNLYRLTGETWKDASDNQVRQLDFSYDLVDNLLTATDPSASYTYAYDDLDRPTAETQNLTALPDDVEFTHGYDLVHNHTSVAAKTGPTLDFLSEYTLDNLHRVTSVTQRGQGGRDVAAKHVAFTYDIASQMTDISRYSDFEVDPQELVAASHFGYDQVGRLTSIVHASTELPPATTWDGDLTTAPTSTPSDTISAYHLVYDKANRLATFESFADQFWADYDYDDRNQLTVADYSGPGSLPDDETYVFDANGNRDSVTIGSTTDDFVPGQDNRLASNGAFRFQYDEEGNRVARYIDDGDGEFGPNDTDITEYEWDHRNRLTRITERDDYAAAVDKVIEYNYDLFDRRISKTVDPDGSTGSQQLYRDIFVYAGEHIALEFHDADADGMSSVPAVSHRYLHGPGIDMILADEQIASGTGPGEVYWALPDHLGSTRDVIDSSGTIVGHFVYDTFGKIVSETNPALEFRFTFTGRERDAETPDLMYYRARYYSTSEGLLISKDLLGFTAGDANLYRYVGNKVTTYTDPSGLEEDAAGEQSAYRGPSLSANPQSSWLDPFRIDPAESRGPLTLYHDVVGNAYHRLGGRGLVDGVSEKVSLWRTNPGKATWKMTGPGAVCDLTSSVYSTIANWSNVPDYEKRDIPAQVATGIVTGRVWQLASSRYLTRLPKSKPPAASPIDLMDDTDSFSINVASRSDVDPNGILDVIAHGDAQSIQVVSKAGKAHNNVSPEVFARYLRMHPDWNGQSIRLLSCNTGASQTGFAQRLSNVLGVDVIAPDNYLWAWPNGRMGVAGGAWQLDIDGNWNLMWQSNETGIFVPFRPQN